MVRANSLSLFVFTHIDARRWCCLYTRSIYTLKKGRRWHHFTLDKKNEKKWRKKSTTTLEKKRERVSDSLNLLKVLWQFSVVVAYFLWRDGFVGVFQIEKSHACYYMNFSGCFSSYVTIWLNSIFEIYNCGCSSLSSASTMTTLKKRAYIFQNGKKPHRHTHGHTLTVTLLHSILNILRLLIYYDHTIINEKCALKFSASRSTINKK